MLVPIRYTQKDHEFNLDGSDADNDKLGKAERDQRRRLDKERDRKDGINRSGGTTNDNVWDTLTWIFLTK